LRLCRAFNFILQIQHEPFEPLAPGVQFFDLDFQMADLEPQTFRDFFFIHDVAASLK
jgi:hypothetical protein